MARAKHVLKILLQRGLGFHRYLMIHSVFVALTMRFRKDEGSVLQFLQRLPADANVLDIGANVGTMTVLFARKCTRGTIFAFEPIPENYRAARAVLSLFRLSNARLFPVGVGERRETATMVMPSAGPSVRLEGLSHIVDPKAERKEHATYYNVELIALDDFPELDGLRISGIKIDVENHERFVIRGARTLIARDRPLIYCELWGGQNKLECFSMLAELEYETYVAVGAGIERYDPARHDQINFLFVPQGDGVVNSRYDLFPGTYPVNPG